MNTIEQAINTRISVRDYIPEKLEPVLIKQIENILHAEIKTPFGHKPKYVLVNKHEFVQKEKLKLGTYGFITGAGYFIVGTSIRNKKAYIDYGFALEKIILGLTQLNLGTCWLGGTFNKAEFAKTTNLKPNEIIPAITPVGFNKKQTFRENLIRFAVGAKKRKPAEELFFAHSFNHAYKTKNKTMQFALEMLRLAPSASNKQPWRLLFEDDSTVHFFVNGDFNEKNPLYSVDLQLLDMGIAMCHFQLALNSKGITGTWSYNAQKADLINKQKLNYIATWVSA